MDRIFYDNQEYAKYSDKFLKRFNLADQAAYDALPAATKNDDSKVFFIPELLYKWDFTKSMVDEIQNIEAIGLNSGASAFIRDSKGVHFNNRNSNLYLSDIDMRGKSIEIDIKEMHANEQPTRLLMNVPQTYSGRDYSELGVLKHYDNTGWVAYMSDSPNQVHFNTVVWENLQNDKTVFDGKTIKVHYNLFGTSFKLWVDDTYIEELTGLYYRYGNGEGAARNSHLCIGDPIYGAQLPGTIISGVRIYKEAENNG